MLNLNTAPLEEIEIVGGERISYYPYIDLPAQTQLSPGIKSRPIGVDENGGQIFQYEINHNESIRAFAQEWLAARQAKNGNNAE